LRYNFFYTPPAGEEYDGRMKHAAKKMNRIKDDSLYGLLSSYKSSGTYVQILISEEDDSAVARLTDNPKNFQEQSREKYKNHRILTRLEIGTPKIFLKYLVPENLVAVLGPLLELNIPEDKIVITDSLKKDGIYSIETSVKYKLKVIQGVRKLLNMSPQKKYEILEKYLSDYQE
jgi:hypothetical protein